MRTRHEPDPPAEADGEGWGDRPGDTALSLRIPRADPLVTAGFPAHVTLLYPFVHESRLDPGARRELARLCRAHPAFGLGFARFGRYPGVLYLEPEPHDPVLALRAALRERWPEAVPYRGIFGPEGLPPHLTLANHEGPGTCASAYDALERRYAGELPIHTRVTAVHLIVWREGAWQDADVLPLGP